MKKSSLKRRRNISILVLVLVFTCLFSSISYASGAGSAAKSGTYCLVAGAFSQSSSNSSKISGLASVKNLYAGKVYTTLSVRMYDTKGKLQDSKYYSRVLSSKGQLQTDLIQTNRSYKVKATGSVYRGPSASSGQLESVTITIN